MWPPTVEEVATVFRTAGVEARLEELAVGEDAFPGPAIRAQAFLCDGRVVVALVPAETEADPRRLGCTSARELAPPRFPFRNADVAIDQSLFNERIVWIDAGSPRHVVGLSPVQLARLVRARAGDFALDAGGPR
jgi:prolyl-tRNA editing enzyme YbaK/EbsC (Cys-tRNA(Pro) deacylase)